MELRRDRAEARWFLHAQGHTLGPYNEQRVRASLQSGEVLPSDKVYSAEDGTWTSLSSHPYFRRQGELLAFRRADQLSAPPSPRILLRSKPVAPPPIPVLPLRAAPELPARMHDPVVTRAPEPLPEPEAPASPPRIVETEPAAILPPEEKGLLETVELGPHDVVHVEPLVLVPRPAPVPAADLRPGAPEEIFEDEDLEAMARALERALDSQPAQAPEVAALDAQFPARPEIKPVFLAEPAAWISAPEARKVPRVIQIQLKLPEGAWGKAVAILFALAVAAGAGYGWSSRNKTRDQKGFHLSDPSSPIAVPLETGDPIPSLKAPTRPQRD